MFRRVGSEPNHASGDCGRCPTDTEQRRQRRQSDRLRSRTAYRKRTSTRGWIDCSSSIFQRNCKLSVRSRRGGLSADKRRRGFVRIITQCSAQRSDVDRRQPGWTDDYGSRFCACCGKTCGDVPPAHKPAISPILASPSLRRPRRVDDEGRTNQPGFRSCCGRTAPLLRGERQLELEGLDLSSLPQNSGKVAAVKCWLAVLRGGATWNLSGEKCCLFLQ